MSATRQRGVRASRARLEHHMLRAGIKSQAELARKIADAEGLDSPPKDLVNRIFRQHKVEYSSLERVASILQVEAYKLYLNSEDESKQPAATDNTHQSAAPSAPASRRRFQYAALAGIIALLVIAALYATRSGPTLQNMAAIDAEELPESLLVPLVEQLYPLATHISRQSQNQRLGLLPQTLQADFELSKAGQRFEVDQVITLDLESIGRYRLLHIDLYRNNNSSPLASLVFSANELTTAHAYIAQMVRKLLLPIATLPSSDDTVRHNARLEARARQLTEQFYDGAKMQYARDLLAQMSNPTATSMATSCFIEVATGWHGNEKAAFERAKKHCEQALVRDNLHPYIQSSNAYRLLRNGQYAMAGHAYATLIDKSPENIEALLGQAELSMHRYLQAPDEQALALQAAISLAQQAIAQDTDYWRSYHQLGNYYYLAKQPELALDVFARLIALSPNPMTLANGALLSLCRNRTDAAREYAQQMLALDSDSYIAHETLFYIHAYQGRLPQALSAMQHAMTAFDSQRGGLYLQWGQLGDAYRWLDLNDDAIASYKKALIEFEQDTIKQLVTDIDSIYALYYQLAIARLEASPFNQAELNRYAALDTANLPPSHLLKAAVIDLWVGQAESGRSKLAKASELCPVYQRAVDFNR